MSQNLTDLLREYLDYYFANLHFSFPGVVREYNAATRRASVQPSLKRRAGNGQYIEFPILSDVPVRYPGSKEYTIHFPLKTGDEVAIHFSERCLDVWKESGGDKIEDPDPRRFALSDCYCSPGLQPQDFIPATENALQIIHKTAPNGQFISQVLMDDDKVDIKYKEKAELTLDEDHINAKTQMCKIDMTKTVIMLDNGGGSSFELTGQTVNLNTTVFNVNGATVNVIAMLKNLSGGITNLE